jgi:hypothetical protein
VAEHPENGISAGQHRAERKASSFFRRTRRGFAIEDHTEAGKALVLASRFLRREFVSPHFSEFIGTRLLLAPEVLSEKHRPLDGCASLTKLGFGLNQLKDV